MESPRDDLWVPPHDTFCHNIVHARTTRHTYRRPPPPLPHVMQPPHGPLRSHSRFTPSPHLDRNSAHASRPPQDTHPVGVSGCARPVAAHTPAEIVRPLCDVQSAPVATGYAHLAQVAPHPSSSSRGLRLNSLYLSVAGRTAAPRRAGDPPTIGTCRHASALARRALRRRPLPPRSRDGRRVLGVGQRLRRRLGHELLLVDSVVGVLGHRQRT